jgi:hypothetical protein
MKCVLKRTDHQCTFESVAAAAAAERIQILYSTVVDFLTHYYRVRHN